jgi:hypothetical protein
MFPVVLYIYIQIVRKAVMLIKETLQTIGKQTELFDRAMTLPGRPRERMVALCEAENLYFLLFPHHCRAMQIIRIASQLTRGASLRYDTVRRCETRLNSLLMNVIHDGIQLGDLTLAQSHEPEELAFILWALAFGTRALVDTHTAARPLGIRGGGGGGRVGQDVVDMLLDSLGWRPLANEWDYEATRNRIRAGIFATEWKQIQ